MPAHIHPHQTHRRPAPRPAPFGDGTAPRPGKWLGRLHWYDEINIARISAYYDTPNVHLPTWRLRFAIAVRLFPILWVLPRCRAPKCDDHWPCKPLLRYLRDRYGWTGSIDPHLKALSTKRRRARTAARNPTAVSHRAGR